MFDSVDVFLEEIRDSLSNINLEVSDSEGSYNDEWLTTNGVSSVFSSINKIIEVTNNSIDVLSGYLSEIEATEAEIPTPQVLNEIPDYHDYFAQQQNQSPTPTPTPAPSPSASTTPTPMPTATPSPNTLDSSTEMPSHDTLEEPKVTSTAPPPEVVANRYVEDLNEKMESLGL